MKVLFKLLTIFYIVFPLIAVPLIALHTGNKYYLLGIIFYYISIMLVMVNQKIIFLIPCLFYLWFWSIYGFGIYTYVFFSLLCLAVAAALYLITQQVEKFMSITIPDNAENLEYDLKMQNVNDRIEKFRQANPTTKITQEIMESIRNEVFFA